ncbi:AraC family transcriptional regulator [Aureibaculum sp. 2210JD6-5]|uniref:AraC family transcriptional regulator n=1 Tax=Aureibaculum sp. 2210JD6-5 TaxID=3103957 RepID=UPI002AAEDCE9|nr:AraC family transcriptional regulator [Aureibaculum sp. 2210JD6-5]MDY7396089.1 AraC family transcriptional regulator [Aureibaculum sp. 2210JD6-5]
MSKRFFSASSFNVFELDLESWDYPKHRHNFFELVFIQSGNGIHKLNESSFEYNEGDVFLLTPNDEHEFVVTNRTVFGYLKFTEQLFLEKTELVSDLKWRKKIDAVILHANSVPGSIIKNKQDGENLFQLFQLIKKEYETPSTHSRSILLELFGALLMIISRNISGNKLVISFTEKDKVNEILTYTRQNVVDKEKIKISAIADEFNMSPNYVSVFIKKHAGISIQNYVMQTKMKMAERLLKQTSLNFSEIAMKIGFTDSSHFTKAFKKHMGMTPKAFRMKIT